MFQCEIFNILFSYEDKDFGRFSNLDQCTFNIDIVLTQYRGMIGELRRDLL